jgi:hypothetical protein
MLTDEQILQKATLLLEEISESLDLNTFSLLREMTEAELGALERVLAKLADNARGILAFDDLFGDKTRLVIPFPVKDRQSELGEFVYQLEQAFEINVDWEKGMVSVEREWADKAASNKMLRKKFQMKIGKYLAKVDNLVKEYIQIRQKIGDHKYQDRPEEGPGAIGGKHLLNYSSIDIDQALQGDDLNRYHQILNQLELYIGDTSYAMMLSLLMDYDDQANWKDKEQLRRDMQDKGDREHNKPVRTRKPIVVPDTKLVDMGSYWLNNAKKIKEEVAGLESDKYSIIVTRHPIDVMRMSDFEKITSCHTPGSRGGGGEYYKCAVAEAQGHGALVYAVETEDLLSATNTSNLESAEQELNDAEEIFGDDKRYAETDMDIIPVGRTRLRQFRFFDWEKFDAGEDKGTELAVPEKATYGKPPVGLVNRITRWAREKQEEVISNLPRSGGRVDLDNFRIYGGSYEDTADFNGRKVLMANLTSFSLSDFVGDVQQDKQTEEELPPGWHGDMEGVLEAQCKPIREKWNSGKYANCKVEYYIRNEGDDEEPYWVIYPEGVLKLTWPLDEWSQLPNVVAGRYAADYLNERFGTTFKEDTGVIFRGGTGDDEIIFRCEFDTRIVPGMEKEQIVYDGEGFEHFCEGIDKLDNRRDNFQAIIEEFAKQEGYIALDPYINLAMGIEDKDVTSYSWDVRYDGEYDESYEAWATVEYDFDPEELGVEARILFDLVDSRDFNISLRRRLLALAQKEVGTKYHLDTRDTSAVDSGGDVRYSISFKVTLDDPDERVELFKELITGDMDDEDEISKAFMSALYEIAAKNGVKLNSGDPAAEKVRDFDALQDLGEVWRKYL